MRSRTPRVGRWLGTPALVVALTTAATAQTLPLPALPEPADQADQEDAPEARPTVPMPRDVTEAAEPSRPGRWDYALGAGLGWDDNADLLGDRGPRAASLVQRAGVRRIFRGPRGQWRVQAGGRWTAHPGHEGLGHRLATVDLDGSHRSSPGTTWRANVSYELADGASARLLLEQGVLLPRIRTLSFAAGGGVTARLSAGNSLKVDARIYRTEFDALGLVAGGSGRVTVGLERMLGPRATAALLYATEAVASDSAGRSYVTHFVSAEWGRLLSRRSAIVLEGGASLTPAAARAGLARRESFFGGVSFTRKVRRSALTAYARREVTPAFGVGRSRPELRAGLAGVTPLARRADLRIVATYVRPDRRSTPSVDIPAWDAFASVSRGIVHGLEASFEARYRRGGAVTSATETETFQAGVFLTLLSPRGRALIPIR